MHRYNHFCFGGFQLVPAPLSKKQRNLVVKLNRETELHYFNNLETSKNSKPFWNKCSPFFLTNMCTVILRQFLLKNRKLQQIQMRLLKKKLC